MEGGASGTGKEREQGGRQEGGYFFFLGGVFLCVRGMCTLRLIACAHARVHMRVAEGEAGGVYMCLVKKGGGGRCIPLGMHEM